MADKGEKTKDDRIKTERNRLRRLYRPLLDKQRFALALGLIDNAAMMRIELEDLAKDIQENGWTERFKQGRDQEPYDRARPAGQTFNSLNSNYQKIMAQLEKMLPKEEAQPKEQDDGLGGFLARREAM